jgi:hypothetical protein
MPENNQQSPGSANTLDRRTFVGAAAATAGVMFINPLLVRGTAANSAIRVGLLGCGGRGTADATNLVDTGGAASLPCRLFQDQLTPLAPNSTPCNPPRLLRHRRVATLRRS